MKGDEISENLNSSISHRKRLSFFYFYHFVILLFSNAQRAHSDGNRCDEIFLYLFDANVFNFCSFDHFELLSLYFSNFCGGHFLCVF